MARRAGGRRRSGFGSADAAPARASLPQAARPDATCGATRAGGGRAGGGVSPWGTLGIEGLCSERFRPPALRCRAAASVARCWPPPRPVASSAWRRVPAATGRADGALAVVVVAGVGAETGAGAGAADAVTGAAPLPFAEAFAGAGGAWRRHRAGDLAGTQIVRAILSILAIGDQAIDKLIAIDAAELGIGRSRDVREVRIGLVAALVQILLVVAGAELGRSSRRRSIRGTTTPD